jgi:hypothetical protein
VTLVVVQVAMSFFIIVNTHSLFTVTVVALLLLLSAAASPCHGRLLLIEWRYY